MKKSILITIGTILIYWLWSITGRKAIESYQYEPVKHFPIFEKNSATSNIIGVQPFMTNLDYQSNNSFYKKLDFYLLQAQKKDWLQENTTVVFPEHIASWLVAAGEKKSVYMADNMDAAMQVMVLSNLPKFLYYFWKSSAEDSATDAVFQMKAQQMAEIYQSVFKKLAKKYKVNIVAGSIFLPNPSIEDQKLIVGKGSIYNISAFFLSNGKIEPSLTKKKHPINSELPFCNKNKEPIPVFPTNTGNIGVVICADAWYSDIYSELNGKEINTLIAPSYSTGFKVWGDKWQGYNGAETPEEIDKSDIEKITLEEAWHKYTLKRIENTDIKTGIVVFLRGNIWDLGTDGTSFIYRKDSIRSVPITDMPVIFNVENY